ncbi:P-loop NTPase [Erythrobacter sp. SCSIO 43205]|uniref:P-loop NTPase n=1 Tax=Erythrobacter sp. SCSIO 43205 TaxID=2779361 RepID=UPI001CAA2ABF|nr:P-loop NTPase [Erythrobacter sp. SCSIO 43205]UAB77272.1 P-loop NTPase [Erythrobacter sp. SCSIO 43205]
MTEQSNFSRKTASSPQRSPARRTSLFERADVAFGLDGFGVKPVPANLPDGPRAFAPPRQRNAHVNQRDLPQAQASGAPHEQAAPPPKPAERAVALRGPKVRVDHEVLEEEGLISPGAPVTGLLEEFRIIKRELLADAREAGDDTARRILVCSPHSGEGKTYCATNLAIAMAAERDIEVVLVDADVLNPSVSDRLGIETGVGLMDALADKSLRIEDLVSPTDIDGLFILPAGTSSARDSEYLTSARTSQVLDRLTRGAPNRFLIFDTPPALAASPAAELAAHVGQAVLVVRADDTSRAALDDAIQLLSACDDIKLLLNATQFSPSGRRFGDYGEREE